VPTYEGRLELTWTNKPLRLLAHEDGSYEWVPPSDYRVAEVRLLHDAGAVGEVHADRDRAKDNLLIRGDALNALTSLIELPDFEREYVGKVKLAYLDPPFNTQQSFLHYDDALEHSVWLTMMRDRLAQIRELLSPSGSVWVHLDDAEVHRARCVMDELFGANNFIATVIWEKTTSGRNDAQFFSVDQDYILVYARDREQLRINRLAPSQAASRAYKNPDNDTRGPWREVDYKGPKTASERPNLFYPIRHPVTGAEVWPRRERVWAFGPEEHERHVKENLLWWGRTGNYTFPKLKKFLGDGIQPMVPRTFWGEADADTSRRAKDEIKRLFPGVEPFTTPKPEKLLARIMEIATDPGDAVIDCFVGSGTTAAVAHKMGRHWLAVELEAATVSTFAVPRLTKVAEGNDRGGVTEATAWEGGGGFRILDVAPSMFEALDGQVFLSQWATNGKLAEVTAAQLHYDYEHAPPFAGRRGRSRLAVIDGLVNKDVVQIVVNALPEDERVVVCGTAIDPDAKAALRKLRAGSTVRKIPYSILQEYRQAARWTQRSLLAQVPSKGAHTPEGEAAPA
jgi:adenine-specific DNA-methyltransferase